MKYLVRTLMMLVFIPGLFIIIVGLFVFVALTILQFPVWFILKGEFLDDDDTALIWYIENVMNNAGDIWERMLRWSRK